MRVNIDYTRDALLTDQARELVEKFYLRDGDVSPQDAYARMACFYANGDESFAQRIYDAISLQWFMAASPVLSNAVEPGEPMKALPISCFLSFVGDNLESLVGHQSELAWLTLKGGGVGGHWDNIRAVSKKAPGPIPFLKVADSAVTAYKQGQTRKGAYAAYLSVDHPDVLEFLEIRVPSGGDINRKCLNLHNAINLTNSFMEKVAKDETHVFKCPHSGEPRGEIRARKLWEKILEARSRTGEPYLNFIDTANEALHPALKAAGLKIYGSNLCNEIHLPTNEERTAVCCLSSLNLEKWPEWRSTGLVTDLIRFLDNVLEKFIEHAPDDIAKARYSAMRSRDLGLGAMGFHGLLQSMGLAFESEAAASLNRMIFEDIAKEAAEASEKLGQERGAAPDLAEQGYTRRNAHLLAIAPNANSSMIAGASASIEPIKSNAYVHNTRAGSHTIRNKHLVNALREHGLDNAKTWRSIVANDGSVQHLKGLPDEVKAVFKTAFEIDQSWVVRHAADRQAHICQGQSVNLFFPAGSPRAYVNRVHLEAWKRGLKGLYYFRTESVAKADKVGEQIQRVALGDAQPTQEECVACQA
ncbi:Ribonucleoside-diphosphate reductase NrdZ [Pseudoalteromonas sp. THAF3]|uniref:ribonucleoside-diphosphate reductase subunit alpha n=1 Tax=Pseudoalteromonas sp. THAF3 TaxID=2587843 RepID=UPI0012696739|nr:ribonucleoside-diphosphate reductase subunit alpha [Pseudoalteromonas sp. THAF3]QFU04572.1 Ribonucleoside-diphosphate reductase NrdZ [Pseudoalteromonas sp. THAF3]